MSAPAEFQGGFWELTYTWKPPGMDPSDESFPLHELGYFSYEERAEARAQAARMIWSLRKTARTHRTLFWNVKVAWVAIPD